MLSSTSDYALRAILVLAQAEPGRRCVRDEIARATGSPRELPRQDAERAGQGSGSSRARADPLGGFSLAVAPDELTLARIVDCFDESGPQHALPPRHRPLRPRHPCRAHERWTRRAARRAAPRSPTPPSPISWRARRPTTPNVPTSRRAEGARFERRRLPRRRLIFAPHHPPPHRNFHNVTRQSIVLPATRSPRRFSRSSSPSPRCSSPSRSPAATASPTRRRPRDRTAVPVRDPERRDRRRGSRRAHRGAQRAARRSRARTPPRSSSTST